MNLNVAYISPDVTFAYEEDQLFKAHWVMLKYVRPYTRKIRKQGALKKTHDTTLVHNKDIV